MSVSRRTKAVAALIVLGLILGLVIALASTASSSPNLPPVSPERLIAEVIRALGSDRPITAQSDLHVNLGLPSIPAEAPSTTGPERLIAALSGDHRIRSWRSADGVRLAELLPTAELALFVSREDAWAWDSSEFTAYHLGPPPHEGVERATEAERARLLDLADPIALARRALQAIAPTTRVGVEGTGRVAGRDSYVLTLEPRTKATLVRRIEIAIDAASRLPLRVAVFPGGADEPALSSTVTSISFDPIPAGTFGFTPPKGARVVSPIGDASESGSSAPDGLGAGGVNQSPVGDDPVRSFGTGWATIVAVRVQPPGPASEEAGAFVRSLFPYSGPLCSIRLVEREDHVWLLYGAVPQRALVAVVPRIP